jgi:threonine/homoserine/homoserine lactone efflux protein
MFFTARFQGRTLETIPLMICGITMLIAGCVSMLVTRWARENKQYCAVSRLIGVTTIMFMPLIVVIVSRVISEKATAHLVFSYFVVYYLMFLPVGTWLILPPKPCRGSSKADDNQTNIE